MDTSHQRARTGTVHPIGGSREGAPREAQQWGSWVLGSEAHRRFVGSLVATAPAGWVARLEPPRRTNDANAAFHAMLGEISKSGVEVCGEAGRPVDDLKTIFISLWMRATERTSSEVTGLDGEPIQLRRSTTTFSKQEMSELIEVTAWWASRHGVKLRDPRT